LNLAKPGVLFQCLTPDIAFKKALGGFDKIVSTSDYMAKDVMSLGIPREKATVIPTWLNMERFIRVAENEVSEKPAPPTFVYFGWGSSIRGVPDLINAFKLVLKEDTEAKLVVCFTGFHGIEEKMYEYLMKRCAITNSIVSKVGHQDDILDTVKSADAVVLPFRSAFGYAQPPLVVLEAMALGKPVISTPVGSVAEVISDGETGFLVQPRDIDALSEKMLIVSHDKELSRRISSQAQKYVIESHNLESATQKVIRVYESTKR
jgi:glycosyltransferase involved in cell wall biosynthesis